MCIRRVTCYATASQEKREKFDGVTILSKGVKITPWESVCIRERERERETPTLPHTLSLTLNPTVCLSTPCSLPSSLPLQLFISPHTHTHTHTPLSLSFSLSSWIRPPVHTHKKSIPEQTKRATTTPRPPLGGSQWGESTYFGFSFFIIMCLPLILQDTCKKAPNKLEPEIKIDAR